MLGEVLGKLLGALLGDELGVAVGVFVAAGRIGHKGQVGSAEGASLGFELEVGEGVSASGVVGGAGGSLNKNKIES